MADKKKRSGRDNRDNQAGNAQDAARSHNARLALELAKELDAREVPDSPTGKAFVASMAADQETEVPGPSPAELMSDSNSDYFMEAGTDEGFTANALGHTDMEFEAGDGMAAESAFGAAYRSTGDTETGSDMEADTDQGFSSANPLTASAETGLVNGAQSGQSITQADKDYVKKIAPELTTDSAPRSQGLNTSAGNELAGGLAAAPTQNDTFAQADKAAMAALDADISSAKNDMEASMEEDIIGVADGISRRNPQMTENDVHQQVQAEIANMDATNQAPAQSQPESPWVNFRPSTSRRASDDETASFFRYSGGPFPSLLRSATDANVSANANSSANANAATNVDAGINANFSGGMQPNTINDADAMTMAEEADDTTTSQGGTTSAGSGANTSATNTEFADDFTAMDDDPGTTD